MAHIQDPFYTSTSATYLRWVLDEILNVTIYVDDYLRSAAAADRDERAIWVPPGLDFDTFGDRAARAWRYIELGDGATPQFQKPKVADPATSTGAVIIPFQRAPLEQQLPALEQPLPDVAT